MYFRSILKLSFNCRSYKPFSQNFTTFKAMVQQKEYQFSNDFFFRQVSIHNNVTYAECFTTFIRNFSLVEYFQPNDF